jgi:hypothetical protein
MEQVGIEAGMLLAGHFSTADFNAAAQHKQGVEQGA